MATSCKDAIKAWETAEGKVAADSEDVRLCPISLQMPVIQKMDASLSGLKKCKHLRLSTNSIDKITGLNGMECLTILSLGRNQLRKIEGLDANCDTLEQLWVSYNQIGTLAGIEKLHNLTTLFMSNNKIADWKEVERLASLPKLRDLLMVGNPLWQTHQAEGNWRVEMLKRLPNIKVRWLPALTGGCGLGPSGECPAPCTPRPSPCLKPHDTFHPTTPPTRPRLPPHHTSHTTKPTTPRNLPPHNTSIAPRLLVRANLWPVCAPRQNLDGTLIDDEEREQAKAELAG